MSEFMHGEHETSPERTKSNLFKNLPPKWFIFVFFHYCGFQFIINKTWQKNFFGWTSDWKKNWNSQIFKFKKYHGTNYAYETKVRGKNFWVKSFWEITFFWHCGWEILLFLVCKSQDFLFEDGNGVKMHLTIVLCTNFVSQLKYKEIRNAVYYQNQKKTKKWLMIKPHDFFLCE